MLLKRAKHQTTVKCEVPIKAALAVGKNSYMQGLELFLIVFCLIDFLIFFSLDVFFCWLLSLHVGVSLSVSVCLPVYFWFERSGHKTITYQRLREQTTVADHTDRLTDRTKRLLAQKKCRNCHHECQSRLLKQSADGMASKRHISKSFGDHKFSVIFFPLLQKSPLSVSRCHSVFFSFFLAFVCF